MEYIIPMIISESETYDKYITDTISKMITGEIELNHILHNIEYFSSYKNRVITFTDNTIYRYLTIKLSNVIRSAKIIDADFNLDIKEYYLKLYVDDDVEFNPKGVIIPRIIINENRWNSNKSIVALDYIANYKEAK